MSEIDMEELAQIILTGVSNGICRGITHSRRPVKYQLYEQVTPETRAPGQSPSSYVWSEDEYDGTFLGFESGIEADELTIQAMIQDSKGYVETVPLGRFRFVDL